MHWLLAAPIVLVGFTGGMAWYLMLEALTWGYGVYRRFRYGLRA